MKERKLRVLIVDDQDEFTDPLRDLLDETGDIEIVSHPFGYDLEKQLAALNPDVLLLDWALANDIKAEDIFNGDGIRWANKIKKREEWRRLTLFLISQHMDSEEADRYSRQPPNVARGIHFVSKPEISSCEKLLSRILRVRNEQLLAELESYGA